MATKSSNSRRTSGSNRTARVARASKKSSSIISLENGIKIVKHAIRTKTSLSAASNANNKGKNYVSDIKARLEENYKSKNISRELYNTFKSLSKQHEKAVK